MLECIRCGTSQDLIFHDFTYDILPVFSKNRLIRYGRFSYFTRKIRESLHSTPIQVCRNCKKLFDKWLLIENVIFFIGSIEFALSLFFGIGFILTMFLGPGRFSISQTDIGFISPLAALITFSIIFLLFLINIIWFLIHKQKDSNPRRYIRMGAGIVPLVRPHLHPAWIDYKDWLNALEHTPVQSNRHTMQKSDPYLKFEKIIYKILKSNSRKAYTFKAILNRIVEQLSDESEKQFIRINGEEILNEMSLKNQIKVVIKNGEGYYMIK